MKIDSKLPLTGTSIFAVMSALSQKHGAVNLGQGFPNFDPSPRLQNLVSEAMKNGHNQYAPMPGVLALREQVSNKIYLQHKKPISADNEITITAGATQALFCAIAAVVRAGDEVIIFEPAYDCYRPAVELCGGVPVIYELTKPDYQIDWSVFKNLITERTRLVIINTPSNPAATTFSDSDFLELQTILADTNAFVLSDEVYEHLVFDDKPHISILNYPALFERSLSTYSFGKTFHNTGWKMGYVVAPPALTAELRKVHQFNVFAANHPIQAALAEFLKDENEWRGLPDFYQQKRDFFQKILAQTRFKLLPCAGTYFQNVDFSAISEEADDVFARRLIADFGVATIPVSAFFSSKKDEKVLRLCFAKTENLLLEAGKRLASV